MQKLNVLVAYPYMKKPVIEMLDKFNRENPGQLSFLLDSGAFTAYNAGKVIKIDDYLSFLDNLPIKCAGYFMLDVIGDPQKTKENYEYMLARGYDPIPVVTSNEEAEMIDYYYDHTDYIALGGLQFLGKKKQLITIDNFSKKINGRKYHLLGLTGPSIIKHFMPYSCDASTWTSFSRFGRGQLYYGNGKTKSAKINDFAKKPTDETLNALKMWGVSLESVKTRKNWHGKDGIGKMIGACSALHFTTDMERKIKTKLYLACSNDVDLGFAISGYKQLIKNGIIT